MNKSEPAKKVLITGANGFLGRHAATYFHEQGYYVYGMGRQDLPSTDNTQNVFVLYKTAIISVESLQQFNVVFDCIVHCAGGSSVARSIENPLDDFKSTVGITMEVLEFIRLYSPATRLIYPSSASVYGEHDASQIKVDDPLKPVSPYGMHKKITEELCLFYHQLFNVDVVIIRFFSIYGPGLQKQLIWDACKKIRSMSDELVFWGTGTETRDWLFIDDAVSLVYLCATRADVPLVINGGSGGSTSISDTLVLLASTLGVDKSIGFNGMVKAGDPRHYHADMQHAFAMSWRPETSLAVGLQRYVAWFKDLQHD